MTDQIVSDIISVGWLVENKIFGVQIGGEPESHTMTILDSLEYDPIVMQHLDAATEPIHILIHIQPLKTTPPVSRLLGLKYPRHPRTGHLVIVNTSNTPMVRFFMSIVGSVGGSNSRAFRAWMRAWSTCMLWAFTLKMDRQPILMGVVWTIV